MSLFIPSCTSMPRCDGASCLSAPFLVFKPQTWVPCSPKLSLLSNIRCPLQLIQFLSSSNRSSSSAFLGRVISLPSLSITLPKWGNVSTLSWELHDLSSRSLYASSGASLLPLLSPALGNGFGNAHWTGVSLEPAVMLL